MDCNLNESESLAQALSDWQARVGTTVKLSESILWGTPRDAACLVPPPRLARRGDRASHPREHASLTCFHTKGGFLGTPHRRGPASVPRDPASCIHHSDAVTVFHRVSRILKPGPRAAGPRAPAGRSIRVTVAWRVSPPSTVTLEGPPGQSPGSQARSGRPTLNGRAQVTATMPAQVSHLSSGSPAAPRRLSLGPRYSPRLLIQC